jgi:hypothetical protein
LSDGVITETPLLEPRGVLGKLKLFRVSAIAATPTLAWDFLAVF